MLKLRIPWKVGHMTNVAVAVSAGLVSGTHPLDQDRHCRKQAVVGMDQRSWISSRIAESGRKSLVGIDGNG